MKTKTLTIIPQQNNGLIAEIVNKQIKVLYKFDIPYDSTSKILNNKTIATLDRKNKQLLFHTIEGIFMKSIKVPFSMTMNVKGNVVYVGGHSSKGEVCYMINLDNEPLAIKNIHLPKPMTSGKAVDDILILDDTMLLIDNIVFPKYTFVYDISIATEPVHVQTIQLPHNRTYESIIKGDMNQDWIIYLSSASCEEGGYVRYITCHRKKELIFTFENTECRYNSKPVPSFQDITLINDKLYVLTNWGLGYYDLMTDNIKSGDLKFIKPNIVANRILKVNDDILILVSKKTYKIINLDHINLQSSKSILEQYNKMKFKLYLEQSLRKLKNWLGHLI